MTAERRAFLTAALAAALAAATADVSAGEPARIDDPPPGKALIVFYRTWSYPGMANAYTVREGGAELGSLSVGRYFTAIATPGLHTYSVRAERKDDMQLVVDADETYYVRLELDTGWLLYQPTLVPSEQRLFDQASTRLKPARPAAPEQPMNAAVPAAH